MTQFTQDKGSRPTATSFAPPPSTSAENAPDGAAFRSKADGLYAVTEGGADALVCSPLQRLGYVTDLDGSNPAHIVEITTVVGAKRIELPETLVAQPQELKLTLIGAGVLIEDDGAAIKNISRYLKSAGRTPLIKRVEANGWTKPDGSGGYVFAETLYDANGDSPIMRPPTQLLRVGSAGNMVDWLACTRMWRGNPLLIATACFALASSLLRPLGKSTFCVSIVGPSSTGKTTALRLALALTAAPHSPLTWAGTANGLLAAAVEHNDSPFVLDEIGQADPHDLDRLLYDLTNGRAKQRARADGTAADTPSISTVLISAGEESLFDRLRSGGKPPKEGHVARFITLTVDRSSGIASKIHEATDRAAFIQEFRDKLNKTYGLAWPVFIRYVATNIDALKERYLKLLPKIRRGLIQGSDFDKKDNIAMRVLDYFAIATFSGYVAFDANIIDLTKKDIGSAMRECFASWHRTYSRTKSEPDSRILDRIRKLILKNLDAIYPIGEYEKHAPSTPFGFRQDSAKLGESLLLISPHVFDGLKEKYGEARFHETLRKSEWLVPGSKGRPTKQTKVPGGENEKFPSYALREAAVLACGDPSI